MQGMKIWFALSGSAGKKVDELLKKLVNEGKTSWQNSTSLPMDKHNLG